ncbi:MAG: AmmeMemoRadiSam system protein A [Rhodothermaceae bacterium]
MQLRPEEKDYMLGLVRNTILQKFNSETEDYPEAKFDVLHQKNGAFVTITNNGKLRGCIGYIIGYNPLNETLKEAAIQAAFHDPRFNPLTEKEFTDIKIEVSILSEPFPMNSYDEIEVGTHGLILTENDHRGLLLPQVPVEHNMDKEDYLAAICQKSGLPADYWQSKTLNLELFTATVFSEDETEK